MDRKSIILERKSITSFLSSVKFNKDSYDLYIDIVNGKIQVDENVFILMICQTALQVGFDGFFEELYMDIIKRRSDYIKQIILNLRTAFLSTEGLCTKISKKLFCRKITNREIMFNRCISLFDFDRFMSVIFIEGNKEKEEIFKTTCNQILQYRTSYIRKDKIVPIN